MTAKKLLGAFAGSVLVLYAAKSHGEPAIDVKPSHAFPISLEQRTVGVYFRDAYLNETQRFHGLVYDKERVIVNWHGFMNPVRNSPESQVASRYAEMSNLSDISKHYIRDIGGKIHGLNGEYCADSRTDLAVVSLTNPLQKEFDTLQFRPVKENENIGLILITDGTIELRHGKVTKILGSERVRNYDGNEYRFNDVFKTTLKGRTGNSGGIGFFEGHVVGMVSFGKIGEEDKERRDNLGFTNADNIKKIIEYCIIDKKAD